MEVPTQAAKTPEAEPDTPTRIQPPNGLLKRHAPMFFVAYRECLRNHAAGIGGHAVDGCGEFLPSLAGNVADPGSYACAACGCHRNFHRREPEGPLPYPGEGGSSPSDSPSPPPISSAYAPHVLLAAFAPPATGRKRFRTKFSNQQREKMLELAEKVGWKMLKRDDDLIEQSCNQIGVERSVFKVWMHNNKNSLAAGKKEQESPVLPSAAGAAAENSSDADANTKGTNGSSSSSDPMN